IHAAAVYGDVAEFGCFMGNSAQVLATALARSAEVFGNSDVAHGIATRRLWLFDSFKGLPRATDPIDVECPHVKAGVWTWTADESPENLTNLMAQYLDRDRVSVVPGWFKDTLPTIPNDTRFAMVHVDCDLYESAYQVLDYLFAHEHLSDGCALYFDDWYCNRGSPSFGQQRAFAEVMRKHEVRITDWGAYGTLGRRFIAHQCHD